VDAIAENVFVLAEALGWIGQVDEAADVLLKLTEECDEEQR